MARVAIKMSDKGRFLPSLFKEAEISPAFCHRGFVISAYFKSDSAPIVDLAPTLELLDWIDATTSFIKYGELEELSMKIRETNDNIWKRNIIEKPIKLGEFSRSLERLSNLSRLTYVPLLSETSKEMSELLNRVCP